MKDLEEGDSVDREAEGADVSLVRILYSKSADRPSPPVTIRARSVFRRRAGEAATFGFALGEAEDGVDDDGPDALLFDALPTVLLLLLLPEIPLEVPLPDPAGAACTDGPG